jgi:hypothetical protein
MDEPGGGEFEEDSGERDGRPARITSRLVVPKIPIVTP